MLSKASPAGLASLVLTPAVLLLLLLNLVEVSPPDADRSFLQADPRANSSEELEGRAVKLTPWAPGSDQAAVPGQRQEADPGPEQAASPEQAAFPGSRQVHGLAGAHSDEVPPSEADSPQDHQFPDWVQAAPVAHDALPPLRAPTLSASSGPTAQSSALSSSSSGAGGHTAGSHEVLEQGAVATSTEPGHPMQQAASRPEERPHDADTLAATQLVKRTIAFPGAQRCGAWSDAYVALHKQVQSGQHPAPRFLVYRGEQGLGDRLLGLVSTFLIALLTSRALLIDGEILPLAFEPALVDWRPGPHYWAIAAGTRRYRFRNPKRVVTPRQVRGPLARAHIDFVFPNGGPNRKTGASKLRVPPDLKGYFERFNAAPILSIDTNGGVLTQILREDSISPSTKRALLDMGLRMDNGFACILRLLMRPQAGAWKPIVPTVVRMGVHRGHPALCLQERSGDRASFNKKTGRQTMGLTKRQRSSVQSLLRCGAKIMTTLPAHLRPRKSVSWFLITESQRLREYVHITQKDVIQSPVVPQHVAFVTKGKRQAALEVVQDWLLFSLCEYYVLGNSGFSKTAAAYSLVRKAIFTHPNFGWAFGKCDGNRPDTLESIGNTWSGL